MELDLSYMMETDTHSKTENDVKTEGEEESKTEDDKTEGEKGPNTLKSSNALAALVQVTSRSLYV